MVARLVACAGNGLTGQQPFVLMPILLFNLEFHIFCRREDMAEYGNKALVSGILDAAAEDESLLRRLQSESRLYERHRKWVSPAKTN